MATNSNRREGGVRVTVCKAKLKLDGQMYDVHDFSCTGFEAHLPSHLKSKGVEGKGELHFQTKGLDNVQDVHFRVVRVAPSGLAAATYVTSNSRSTYRNR